MIDATAEQLFKSAQQHCDARRYGEALAVLAELLSDRPDHAEAMHLSGVCLAQLGRKEEAESALRAALSVRPDYAVAMNNLGALLAGNGRAAEAVDIFTRAAALRPQEAVAQLNLANALYASEQYEPAIPVYRRCLVINPNIPEACQNLGMALKAVGKSEEAVGYFNQAAAMRARDPNIQENFGTALRDVGRLDEAMACYRRAVAIKPDHASAQWNMGLLHLMRGEFEQGWRLHERRLDMESSAVRVVCLRHPSLAQPRWNGSSLAGRRLYVYAEPNYGDTIQFARYLPMLARQAGGLTLACQNALVPLLSGLEGVEQCIPLSQSPPPLDEHSPLMSLPLLLKTTLDTIPADVPYIHAKAANAARWRERLSGDSRRRIGLVWSAGRKSDPRGSLPPAALAPLSAIGNVRWISLQKLDAARPDMEIADWAAELADFSDTAALLANLDLVITVDTAVAHLAGAMGKPVWLLLKAVPDWRWMLDRADSPWYPTMRLFRQKRSGDWQTPIGELARSLANT